MKTIHIYKSPWKGIKLLALSLPFVLMGIWILFQADGNTEDLIMGWVTTLFFGLGLVVALLQLLDRRPQILLNEAGVWDRSTGLGWIPWELVNSAYLFSIHRQHFISLVLDPSFEAKVKQYKWASWMNKKMGAQKVNLHLGFLKIDTVLFEFFMGEMSRASPENRKKIMETFPGHLYGKMLPDRFYLIKKLDVQIP